MTKDSIPQEHEDEYDDEYDPTPEEIDLMRKATASEQAEVDALLIANCNARWQKVAMVVGNLLGEFDKRFPHLPYIYMQVRLLELEDKGLIEIQGDVMQMRASEVRLTSAPSAA